MDKITGLLEDQTYKGLPFNESTREIQDVIKSKYDVRKNMVRTCNQESKDFQIPNDLKQVHMLINLTVRKSIKRDKK